MNYTPFESISNNPPWLNNIIQSGRIYLTVRDYEIRNILIDENVVDTEFHIYYEVFRPEEIDYNDLVVRFMSERYVKGVNLYIEDKVKAGVELYVLNHNLEGGFDD